MFSLSSRTFSLLETVDVSDFRTDIDFYDSASNTDRYGRIIFTFPEYRKYMSHKI
jgi:hypothetical protein